MRQRDLVFWKNYVSSIEYTGMRHEGLFICEKKSNGRPWVWGKSQACVYFRVIDRTNIHRVTENMIINYLPWTCVHIYFLPAKKNYLICLQTLCFILLGECVRNERETMIAQSFSGRWWCKTENILHQKKQIWFCFSYRMIIIVWKHEIEITNVYKGRDVIEPSHHNSKLFAKHLVRVPFWQSKMD